MWKWLKKKKKKGRMWDKGTRERMHMWLHLTLCDPMDCSPPGSSVLGILQARILEWVATPSYSPRTYSPGTALQGPSLMPPALAGRSFTTSTTWEAWEKMQWRGSRPKKRQGESQPPWAEDGDLEKVRDAEAGVPDGFMQQGNHGSSTQ